jgi:FtsH-binding integral membrane protein
MGVIQTPKTEFASLMYKKRWFMASVYSLLAVQVAITAVVAVYLRNHPVVADTVHKYFWTWFISSLVLIIVLSVVKMPSYVKLGVLCLFSFTMGLNCIAAYKKINEQVIQVALIGTLGLFVLMSFGGLLLLSMGVHLNFLGYVLMCALLALLAAFIVMIFVPVSSTVHKAILVFGITLFSVFVAYDTNVMVQPSYSGDAIDASVNLYLDVINIFTEMVGFQSN